jgi:hypothetical protein
MIAVQTMASAIPRPYISTGICSNAANSAVYSTAATHMYATPMCCKWRTIEHICVIYTYVFIIIDAQSITIKIYICSADIC